ncbi:hypothetical protein M6D93_18535 [Jatrophihabitans telluris]|uniref:tRNA adenosine deaminase n=1 Tax=Jatrophihabitans telluris TaxID=2038343 RepID=A0ABY4QZH6_9ACTN|nr:tRNA adenosine deaminase-associated protein [Jatrophihabitans telluris]UQX88261.1 hypothetical protein M6D93_18535 [Jatrophihabitans telluris]
MSHFACAVLGDRGGWRITELTLDDCESVDDAVDLLRDFDEPIRFLFVEQDDEYAVLLRCDSAASPGGYGALDEEAVRVFLSNGHAADDYPMAALFADGLDEIGGDPLDDDELAEGMSTVSHDAAPFGDPDLVEDLGMKGPELIELALHESTLPMDLIESVCERIGCLDEFEAVRG